MHDNHDRRFGSRGMIARLGWLYLTVAMSLFMVTAGIARAEVVNINKADAQTLQQHLRDIGPTRSQAIVDYRKKHGPFKTIDDLAEVPGMGPKLVDKNRRSVSTKKGVYKTDAKASAQRSAAAGSNKAKATTAKPGAKASGTAKQHDTKAKTTSPKDKSTKSTKNTKNTKKDAKSSTTKTKKTSTAGKKTAKKKSDKKKKTTDKKKGSSKKSSKSTP